MIYAFDQEQLDKTEDILEKNLIKNGVKIAIVLDMAGHIIASCKSKDCTHDMYSLAALAAGNFSAVEAMAKIVGEEEFSLLFHKGADENLHFSKISKDLLLITTFGNEVSLGFLRMKISESLKVVRSIF
ncbi:MAG: roadblock/LC7 domain-containing protein [Deltaproteobacteria bacterium]|nr:roadblock/LC7 domain-containing protein [Deltaproteobacteria bacterium]NNK85124.1 roadblock/LC7 domain-containing protein [Desulfobacterales bacterium]